MKGFLWKIWLLIVFPGSLLVLAILFLSIIAIGWVKSTALVLLFFVATSVITFVDITKRLRKTKNQYREKLSGGTFDSNGIFSLSELAKFSEMFLQNGALENSLIYNETTKGIRKELRLLEIHKGRNQGYQDEGLGFLIDLKTSQYAGTVIRRYEEEYEDRWVYLKDDKIVNCQYFNVRGYRFQWCTRQTKILEPQIINILNMVATFLDTYKFVDDIVKFEIRVIDSICMITIPQKSLQQFKEISIFSLFSKRGLRKVERQFHDSKNMIDLIEEGIVKLFN